MREPEHCETCGIVLKDGALGGRCPRCMLELGLGFSELTLGYEDSGERDVSAEPARIARYRIIRRIGEGGMGVVYEAEQEHPRRTVALKIIKPSQTSSDILRRFELEAEALGRLQHPGIAQIYEAGTADIGFGPQPFFAMELVRGIPPKEYADAHGLSPRRRMEIIAKIADAVQHAHQRGLIHRDLKPGNILVDSSGQPKILDFGVARLTDHDAQSTVQTGLGQLIGTLAYMSPEQVLADSRELDIRTDVYSIGVILYELLTGRLPYTVGRRIHEVVQAIREEDPVRLSSISRVYRGDIETIAAKALEKNKTRRYSSAGDLAADIRRYLNDEPIEARPPSATYQLQKFARRHKALVAAFAGIFVALIGGIIASTFEAAAARRERDRAAAAEKAADAERDRAIAAQRQAITAEEQARQERDKAVLESRRADSEAATANALRLTDTWQRLARESLRLSGSRQNDDLAALLARQAMLVHSRLPDQPRPLVEDALQQAARMTRWNHALVLGPGPTVALSRDARWVATVAEDGVRIWDTGKPAAPAVILQDVTRSAYTVMTFSNDGTRLAAGDLINIVRVWNLLMPAKPPEVFNNSEFLGPVRGLAFSSDGTRLAAEGDNNTLRVWDARNAAAPPVLLRGPRQPFDRSTDFEFHAQPLSFSPEGTRIAAPDRDNVIRIWDLMNPDVPTSLRGSDGPAVALVFSADGTRLTAAARDNKVRTWDLRKPDDAPLVLIQTPAGRVWSAAFSRNLEKAAVAVDNSVRVWDLRNPKAAPLLIEGPVTVRAMVFSTDGEHLFSSSDAVRRLDFNDSDPPTVRPLQIKESVISSVNWPTFSPNLDYFAISVDQTVRLWESRNPATSPMFVGEVGGFVTSLTFSPDSRRIASGSADKRVHIWSIVNSKDMQVLSGGHDGPVVAVAFSHDGERLASVSVVNSVRVLLWNWRRPSSRPVRFEMPVPSGLPRNCLESFTFSPDLNRLACGGSDNRAIVWDLTNSSKPPLVLQSQTDRGYSLAFSSDSNLLALASSDSRIRIWDLRAALAPPRILVGRNGLNYVVAFSQDGRRIASTGAGTTLSIWDLKNPSLPAEYVNHEQVAIKSLRLSPNGDRVGVFGESGAGIELLNLWSSAADYLCTRVQRNMSVEEWQQYVGPDVPYERTCPSLPAATPVSRH